MLRRLWLPLISLILCICSSLLAQQVINPTTQVNWPLITGTGAPAGSCTSLNYGQPYQNLSASPNTYYTCGSDGWAVRGNSGSMTWPATPGLTNCTGTPCTAWGTTVKLGALTDTNWCSYSTSTGLHCDNTPPSSGTVPWPSTAGIVYWTSGTAWGGAYNASNPIPANYLPAALGSTSSVNGTAIPSSSTLVTTATTSLPSVTSVNGTAVPSSAVLTVTVAAGTVSLGTSSISLATCTAAISGTVTSGSGANVLSTDNLRYGFNSDPTATTGYAPATTGMLTVIGYPVAGMGVKFKVCNNTAASITPGSVTLNWQVVR